MLSPNNLGTSNYSSAAYLSWVDATGTSYDFYP